MKLFVLCIYLTLLGGCATSQTSTSSSASALGTVGAVHYSTTSAQPTWSMEQGESMVKYTISPEQGITCVVRAPNQSKLLYIEVHLKGSFPDALETSYSTTIVNGVTPSVLGLWRDGFLTEKVHPFYQHCGDLLSDLPADVQSRFSPS